MVNQRVLGAGSGAFGLMNVPKRLYKFFTEARYARDLVERGVIRIGTLYEFRATDGWDELRGDAGEGQFTFSLKSAERELITKEDAPWFLRGMIEELGVPIASHGGALNARANHPDAYLFCTTSESAPAQAEWYGSACVAILDVPRFFSKLTQHLTDSLGVAALTPHGYAAPCLYMERDVLLSSSRAPIPELPLAFLKPVQKKTECEVRALWHPRVPGRLEPILTECRGLVGLTAMR